MIKPVEYIRCHVQMESGFVLEGQHDGFARQTWSPGEPEPSCWMGLKLKKDQIVLVTSLPCPVCGHLESYAIREEFAGS
ncbi:MAG TPA: hypothetical protein VJP02_30980 [Candidatus Sulfotelmatobacter sp.]|nr:hypothetical protein [Candidatus Sulfotelmatobacter sp.]